MTEGGDDTSRSPSPKDPGSGTASKPPALTHPRAAHGCTYALRALHELPPEGLKVEISSPVHPAEKSELLFVRKAGLLEACSPPRSLDPRWQSEHAAEHRAGNPPAAAEHHLNGSRLTCSLFQLNFWVLQSPESHLPAW